MNLLDVYNRTDLLNLVAQKRQLAQEEAEDYGRSYDMRYIQSRGTWLCTADKNGDQCHPAPEAECHVWPRTLKSIRELIAQVKAGYPTVHEVYIAGDFDAARSIQDWANDDYEPWVCAWRVVVWQRESQPTEEKA